ncbi:hypothetical protein SUGI_0571550 [Cryptomeria japonica]|nr:hypothetical protein SUGI_0571550 [Cryptomeria japonica]
MSGVLDVVYCSMAYIPSSTRNIPLMLRQLFVFGRRLYSYLLRSAQDLREIYMSVTYLQFYAWSEAYESNGSVELLYSSLLC